MQQGFPVQRMYYYLPISAYMHGSDSLNAKSQLIYQFWKLSDNAPIIYNEIDVSVVKKFAPSQQ